MKLIKNEEPFLTKPQVKKLFLASSIITLVVYAIAMVFSLCGSKYFILNYENTQMDRIEAFLNKYNLYSILMWFYSTIEFYIVGTFICRARPKWYYVLAFFAVPLILYYCLGGLPDIVQTLIPIAFYIVMPIIDNKKLEWQAILRLAIAMAVTFILQFMIYVIKAGQVSTAYVETNMSEHFIYTLEYDIALLVILATITLYLYREKGDSICTAHGGFSQTSTKQSQKSSLKKALTKKQKNKIRLLYVRFYLTQMVAFLLLMVLPFVLGKVLEFLVMYLAFAIARNILGFKYSLHYKKETVCVTVGVLVFGILSLAVPFFYVVIIMAIALGVGLAVLLHFSYKYKGMWLFNKVAKPDKFAELYVIFDGDISEHHVKKICIHYGLSKDQSQIVCEYTQGDKMSVIAHRHNYSIKTIERELTDIVGRLKMAV